MSRPTWVNVGKCLIDGCESHASTRGLCNAHYIRKRRTGDPVSPRKRGVRGRGSVMRQGYRRIAGKKEHILVAEKALGRLLPPGAVVHHVNEDKLDNRGSNLVICPSNAYHHMLHRRARAYDACGHADWRRCCYCKQWDAPENMKQHTRLNNFFHAACAAKDAKARRSRSFSGPYDPTKRWRW